MSTTPSESFSDSPAWQARPTPEHEKMATVREHSQAIGEFLEWAGSEGYQLGSWQDHLFWPVHKSIQQWLADYFNIDLNLIEQEKRQMLEDLRIAGEIRSGYRKPDGSSR